MHIGECAHDVLAPLYADKIADTYTALTVDSRLR
jgi:hypothetical protein